jgi:hypothetical protein
MTLLFIHLGCQVNLVPEFLLPVEQILCPSNTYPLKRILCQRSKRSQRISTVLIYISGQNLRLFARLGILSICTKQDDNALAS